MIDEYSQGVCHDGAAILCNGVMLTVDEVVKRLNRLAELEAEKADRKRRSRWLDAITLADPQSPPPPGTSAGS